MDNQHSQTLLGTLREKYENSAILSLSSLFIFVTLCNMFIMYRLLLDVIPYPIGVTFSQLLVGMMLAYVLGGCDLKKVKDETLNRFTEYVVPVGVYLLMFTIANILLKSTPVIAVYPCILALAVVLHHIFRYLFCDQRNLLSFKTVLITALSYIVACFDTNLVPPTLLGLSILYAISSAIFRAVCLEKALHVTDRDANKLYNVQVFCGVFALFFATIIFEPEFFLSVQSKSLSEILLSIGCLVTVGTIPFVKNIIANKLVTIGQQAPWRFSEIVSVALFFVFGIIFFECDITITIMISFILVITGRTMSMVDIINNDNKRHSGSHHKRRHVPKDTLAFNDVHEDTTSQMIDPPMRDMSMQNTPNGYEGGHESELEHDAMNEQGIIDQEEIDPESGVVQNEDEE
ncbi:putative transmembrane domain-containing protein [Cryptosporidium canis]|uniref:Transmembrane domain-containing protein n=1 Tax=Cryptosporidium canis TaxID=195482 RepID=A0A9D5DL78_9CRYT|nr:putative transmembrane domain-containing protein [Cryptosporidium canis]